MQSALICLARQDDCHYIACTAWGEEVMLQWRHAQIGISRSALIELGDFYAQALPYMGSSALLGNSRYCILRDENDRYEVWVLGVGFYLSAGEFERFAQLIVDGSHTARAHLDASCCDREEAQLN